MAISVLEHKTHWESKLDLFYFSIAGICLLFLSTRYASSPFGLFFLLLSVAMSYVSRKTALIMLFGGTMLSYVYGVPMTAGFAILLLFLPLTLPYIFRILRDMPIVFVTLIILTFMMCAVSYSFHRSLDVVFLCFGLLAMLQTYSLIKFTRTSSTELFVLFGIAFSTALAIPLLSNVFFNLDSPFFHERHLWQLKNIRYTIGTLEPNIVAAWMACAFAVVVFSAKFKNKNWTYRTVYILTASLLLYGTNSVGSRTAFVAAAIVILLSLAFSFLFYQHERVNSICVKSVGIMTAGIIVAGFTWITVSLTILETLPISLERILQTTTLEETGRPYSLRLAEDTLDKIPLAGVYSRDYILHSSPLSPHNSFAASLLYLGLLVCIPYFLLLFIPVCDFLSKSRLSTDWRWGFVIAFFIFITLTIPMTSNRTLFVVLGAWFAYSTLPPLKQASRLPAVSSVSS